MRRRGFPGFRQRPQNFEQDYRVFSVEAKGRPELEKGDKIILPESALRALTQLNVQYPMLFHLSNRETGRTTHCSVMEFSAEEGVCYIPMWMMKNLGLYNGALLNIKNVSLKKARHIKIQPHKTALTEVSNPKAVLEQKLRTYSCMTKGDTFCIEYNCENYFINVLDVQPDGKACIIEADVEVDFAEPLDFEEYKAKKAAEAAAYPPSKKRSTHNSPGQSKEENLSTDMNAEDEVNAAVDSDSDDDKEPKFFQSQGFRTDGKASPTSNNKKTKQKPAAELAKEVMFDIEFFV